MRLWWAVAAWAALGGTTSVKKATAEKRRVPDAFVQLRERVRQFRVPDALAQLHEEGKAFEAFVKKRKAAHLVKKAAHVVKKKLSKAQVEKIRKMKARKAEIFTHLVAENDRRKKAATHAPDDPLYETPAHERQRIDDEWAPLAAEPTNKELGLPSAEEQADEQERKEEAEREAEVDRQEKRENDEKLRAIDPKFLAAEGVEERPEDKAAAHDKQLEAEMATTDAEIEKDEDDLFDSDGGESDWLDAQEKVQEKFEERDRKRSAKLERRLNPDATADGAFGEEIDHGDYEKIRALSPHQKKALRRALDRDPDLAR